MSSDTSDIELLRRYAQTGSPEDLDVVVARYVDLVYSAARRQLGDRHWAEDVTQQVFVVLTRKAKGLRDQTALASWLLKVTALECRNFLKGESRRAKRERKAAHMAPEAQTGSTAERSLWEEVAPHLDAAMQQLSAGDRDAVVLRYLQNQSYGEAASLLGASEASVRQRVYRGLARLRSILASRGVIATEAALGTALLNNALEAAPAGLKSASVLAMAQASAAKVTLVKGALAAMSSAQTKTLIVVVLVLGTLGVATLILLNQGGGMTLSNATTKGIQAAATRPATVPVTAAAADTAAGAPAAIADLQPVPQKGRKLFDVITARSCDERSGTRDGYDHIAFINRGDWVGYHDVDLGPADGSAQVYFCAVVACPDQFAGKDIVVHVGSAGGPVIARLMVESTGGYGTFMPQVAAVEGGIGGVQDIYLVFTGGGFNLKSFKFVVDGRPADSKIAGTSYAQAKGVNEGGPVLVNVRDGAWARYDGLDFGNEGSAALDTFMIALEVDEAHEGAVISVRLDNPENPPLCEVRATAIPGARYPARNVKLGSAVTGKHDVYLTFDGTNRGYQGLADVAWFRFGRAKKSEAARTATQPTRAATTRP
jgi:RNA polymerase sigma factor (sigma-70 family)